MTEKAGFSIERAIRAAAYGIFGCAAVVLVASGGISAVLHPRMHPWFLAAGVLFLLMGVNELRRLFDEPHSPMPVRCYYALLLVIVIGLLFPSVGKSSIGALQAPTPPGGGADSRTAAPAKPSANRAPPVDTPMKIPSGPLVFNDDQYWSVFSALYDAPHDYAGRQITVTGFVYREPRFPPGTCLVGRNLIWCCTADMGLIGFMTSGGELSTVAANTWVEVSGTLDSIPFSISGSGPANAVPLIRLTEIRLLPAHPPGNIFPR